MEELQNLYNKVKVAVNEMLLDAVIVLIVSLLMYIVFIGKSELTILHIFFANYILRLMYNIVYILISLVFKKKQ
jgi:hypothetical protein